MGAMFKNNGRAENTGSPDKLNRLVEGTTVKGEIKTDSNFRLDGELIGTLTTAGKLVVGPQGRIEGDIVCDNADIEGEVTGNIKVGGVLLLKSTARVKGNIAALKLGIENGAEFNGKCNMGPTPPEVTEPSVAITNESELVY